MTTTTHIVHVYAYWHAPQGVTAGWVAEASDDEGQVREHSQGLGWPCDLDDYGVDQAEDVRDALAAEFPDAAIEVVSR